LGVCVAETIPAFQRARAATWAARLAAQLGCRVEVDAVELRAPNRRILHGVKLLHPETGQLMVRLQAADIYDNAAGYALMLQNPDILEEQVPEFYRLVHDNMLTRPVAGLQVTVAMLHDVSWRGSRKIPLRDVRLELRRDSRQTTAALTFGLDGLGGQPTTLQFSRKHLVERACSHLQLNTGAMRLPAQWLSLFAPRLVLPGATAEWLGQFELDVAQHGWSLAGSGQFLALNPSLITGSPVISGRAQMTATDLRISEQGLECFKGRLMIEEGRISDELIGAVRWLGIQPAPAIARSTGMAHPFERLAVDVHLDARGLQLHPAMESQAIAIDHLGALVEQTYQGMIPLVNVVAAFTRAVDPTGSQNLVESAAARSIVQWLPRPTHEAVMTADQTGHQANATSEYR
jgi:hypothetical protein